MLPNARDTVPNVVTCHGDVARRPGALMPESRSPPGVDANNNSLMHSQPLQPFQITNCLRQVHQVVGGQPPGSPNVSEGGGAMMEVGGGVLRFGGGS